MQMEANAVNALMSLLIAVIIWDFGNQGQFEFHR